VRHLIPGEAAYAKTQTADVIWNVGQHPGGSVGAVEKNRVESPSPSFEREASVEDRASARKVGVADGCL
jgi:hypothetical protein